ncbi:hypothetical protein C8Q78DRAFT_995588 [Trametes maxima]|nr:hypothetical protein C8Q78DRAFT_995588 [Trametes maxima]
MAHNVIVWAPVLCCITTDVFIKLSIVKRMAGSEVGVDTPGMNTHILPLLEAVLHALPKSSSAYLIFLIPLESVSLRLISTAKMGMLGSHSLLRHKSILNSSAVRCSTFGQFFLAPSYSGKYCSPLRAMVHVPVQSLWEQWQDTTQRSSSGKYLNSRIKTHGDEPYDEEATRSFHHFRFYSRLIRELAMNALDISPLVLDEITQRVPCGVPLFPLLHSLTWMESLNCGLGNRSALSRFQFDVAPRLSHLTLSFNGTQNSLKDRAALELLMLERIAKVAHEFPHLKEITISADPEQCALSVDILRSLPTVRDVYISCTVRDGDDSVHDEQSLLILPQNITIRTLHLNWDDSELEALASAVDIGAIECLSISRIPGYRRPFLTALNVVGSEHNPIDIALALHLTFRKLIAVGPVLCADPSDWAMIAGLFHLLRIGDHISAANFIGEKDLIHSGRYPFPLSCTNLDWHMDTAVLEHLIDRVECIRNDRDVGAVGCEVSGKPEDVCDGAVSCTNLDWHMDTAVAER